MNRSNRVPWLCIAAIVLAVAHSARAMVMVGGSGVVPDQNWPAGSVDVANQPSRVSWYEGPPFGGGEWVFQYRGDAAALNEVLARFALIKSPDRLLVIHDGVGSNPVATEDERKGGGGRVGWAFKIWVAKNYYQFVGNPAGIDMSDEPGFRDPLPPPRLEVWADSAGLDWAKVKVPAGLTVTDERAASHGYKAEDGSVVAGVVYDMITSKPVPNVQVIVERDEYTSGRSMWTEVASAVGDGEGRFELKKIPPGYYTVVLRRAGYASRNLGDIDCQGGSYKSFVTRLSPAVGQTGIVVGTDGKPLANVTVRVGATVAIDGSGYPTAPINENPHATSDAAGHFTLPGLPQGQAILTAQGDHLFEPDELKPLPIPYESLQLTMTRTGTVSIFVHDPSGKPITGHVTITDQRSQKIGTWGGNDALNADGKCVEEDVPPAKYIVILGRSMRSANPVEKRIEVKPDQTVNVDLTYP